MKRALILLALAPVPAVAASRVQTPISLPPTAAGNAPASVLTAPIAPDGGVAEQILPGTGVPRAWWTMLGSPALDTLVTRALAANNDIATADAALRQSQELARAAGAGQFPQVDAGYQVQRVKAGNVLSPPLSDPNATLYTLHTAQVNVSYTLDVFGGVGAKARSARAATEAQRWRTKAARTTVVANLVQAAVQNAALSEQIAAAREAIAANREILDLIHRRVTLGAAGAADVAAQDTALAAAEAVLPPLERAQKHQQALIAIFIGVAPGNPLPPLPALDDLTLPAQLPLSLPSDVVAHRPDVRAAGAAMEGAAADARAALAARLPSFVLTANAGGAANQFADMFATGNPFWALLGGVTAPVFHAGGLLHQHHAAQAALDAAKSQYRAAVLQAFSDVSDALTALRTDADIWQAAARGDRASAQSLTFARRQYELGTMGTYALLPVAAARAQARATLVQARASRLGDVVALYQALGGEADK